MQVRAKKSLGQHFLTSEEIAARIAASLRLTAPTPVLEIGPGMGILTRHLMEDPNVRLAAVEIDDESVAYLREHMPTLRVVEGDFLKMDLTTVFPDASSFAVIGNFPYNISSQIFFRILEYKDRIPLVAGMLQKEVAERLASPPGSKDYGILSVFLQAYYDVEYLFSVPPTVFNPPPKVNSGVIRLCRNKVAALDCDERLFRAVVKTAFNQRRKTLRNSLKSFIVNARLAPDDHPLLTMRPEQLSVQQFVNLTNLLFVKPINKDMP